jgi:hypothetical protein
VNEGSGTSAERVAPPLLRAPTHHLARVRSGAIGLCVSAGLGLALCLLALVPLPGDRLPITHGLIAGSLAFGWLLWAVLSCKAAWRLGDPWRNPLLGESPDDHDSVRTREASRLLLRCCALLVLATGGVFAGLLFHAELFAHWPRDAGVRTQLGVALRSELRPMALALGSWAACAALGVRTAGRVRSLGRSPGLDRLARRGVLVGFVGACIGATALAALGLTAEALWFGPEPIASLAVGLAGVLLALLLTPIGDAAARCEAVLDELDAVRRVAEQRERMPPTASREPESGSASSKPPAERNGTDTDPNSGETAPPAST